MADAALLELRGITKAFGPRLLFRNVNLRVAPGTVSLLAGPNGAGKSTLMRIMAGLAQPDTGEVLGEVEPEKVGYLGHATFLYPGLTARENLIFWARAAGATHTGNEACDGADAALEAVGLTRHAHERAGVFSRGMAQRLNLARLLQARPALLLLDEPGTGLDVSARALLRDVVADARTRGAAVVWISHDVDEDGALADRVLRLKNKTLITETVLTPDALPTDSFPPGTLSADAFPVDPHPASVASATAIDATGTTAATEAGSC